MTKKAPKHFIGLIGCGTVRDMHLRPLGMCVHSDQAHMSFKWTCKVHMYPFPRMGKGEEVPAQALFVPADMNGRI